MSDFSRMDSGSRSLSDTDMDSNSTFLKSVRRSLSLNSVTNFESFESCSHADNSMRKIVGFYERDLLTDVILIAGLNKLFEVKLLESVVIGSLRIPAHKLVLSAASEYFAAMFTNNLRETNEYEIEFREMDGEALKSLVEFCYTGHIGINENTVEILLSTANILQLTEVVEACCKFLKKQLHPSNCIGIRLFADSHGFKDLFESAHSYTLEHFLEVIRNLEFLMLSAQEVGKIFSSNDVNVPSEEHIFFALLSWIEHDRKERVHHASELLSLVKLPLLPATFIVDKIESNEIFKDDKECRDYITEAFKYQLLPERRTSLQSPRTVPRKSTVGDMYAVGGMDGNKGAISIEKYDVRCDRWTEVASMSGRRLQFGVAIVEDKLFVVGGRDGLKTLNTVECYDIKNNTWSTVPNMSLHRHGLGVAVMDGPLYAVGGHDGWTYLNSVERYDPTSRTWNYVCPMQCARSTVGVAVLNGRLYAVGGRDGSYCLKSVECYDPHTNRWTMCAPMSKKRGGAGVGAANGFLYAMGGHDAPASIPSASRLECVERYDPKTDTWTTVASLDIGRDAVGVCLLGERLFAVGGYDGTSYLKLVEAYNTYNNEWQSVASLNNERAGPCVVAIKNSSSFI